MARARGFHGLLSSAALVLVMICKCQGTTYFAEMNGTNVNYANAIFHNNPSCLQCTSSIDPCGCGSSIDKMTMNMYMTGLANGSYVMFYTLSASALDLADNVTKAHIHPGNYQQVSGLHTVVFFEPPEIFDAMGFKMKKTYSSVVSVGPVEYQGILQSPANYYVNVHTTEYGVGAIRGQLQLRNEPPSEALDLPVSDGTFHSMFVSGPIQWNGQLTFTGDFEFATMGRSVMAVGFTEGETFTSLTIQKGASGTVGPTVLDLSPAINGSQLIATGFAFNSAYTLPAASMAVAQEIAKSPSNYYLQLNTNKNSGKGQPLAMGNVGAGSGASRTASRISWKIALSVWAAIALIAAFGL